MKSYEINTSQMKYLGTLQGDIAKAIIESLQEDCCLVWTIVKGKEPAVKLWVDKE
jgi:hypothetical protein